jgi:hypothetical protein
MSNAIEERITLPELNPEASLKLRTAKTTRGITSSAFVEFLKDGYYSFELYGDFHATVILDTTGRATEKAMRSQHARAFSFESITALKQQIEAFYAAKHAKAAA